MHPADLVALLNGVFSKFDDLTIALGLETIKTLGAAFMAATGLPTLRANHAQVMAAMALGIIDIMERFSAGLDTSLEIRIGVNSGTVVAGVIGKKAFIYDLWGDTVNIASRMEASDQVGCIQVTERLTNRLEAPIPSRSVIFIDVKGRGAMRTYLLTGRTVRRPNAAKS